MRNFIALVYFLLALVGCDGWGDSTIVMRSAIDGDYLIYSKTRIAADVAKFECIKSASGNCHYLLFRGDCRTHGETRDACMDAPFEQFALAAGTTREIVGLPSKFRQCVSHEVKLTTPDVCT